jgi:O-antigen ligase
MISINFSSGNTLVVLCCALTAAVLSGRLTGAHLNMSVSLAIFIVDGPEKMKKNFKMLMVMIISQFVGFFLG